VLAKPPERIDIRFLSQFEEFKAFRDGQDDPQSPTQTEPSAGVDPPSHPFANGIRLFLGQFRSMPLVKHGQRASGAGHHSAHCRTNSA